jgi:hypothetical protein
MEVTGTLQNVGYSLDGKMVVTLLVNEKNAVQNEYQKLMEKDKLAITIAPYIKKRSLSANSYAWVLMGKIAEALNQDVNEVYHIMLMRYGQPEKNEDGGALIISIQSDAQLPEHLYIHSAPIGESELNGKTFTHYRVIKGSSEYNSKEMYVLIEGIVSEAKELGIEILTPQELSGMCERWGE